MVVILCISFAANNTANHFVFNTSNVVSAIGAFAVGFLGNVYSCRFGCAAPMEMVAGELFLVPVPVPVPVLVRSSLSEGQGESFYLLWCSL
ncbi:hypothetical protein BJV77DRAFT_1049645, partial [Russula vinacea]